MYSLTDLESLTLPIILTDIPTWRLKEEVSDEDVKVIAKHLTDWEQLSPHLGLEEEQLDILRDNKLRWKKENLGHEYLELWKRMKEDAATYGALITAAETALLHQFAAALTKLVVGTYTIICTV